MKFRPCIDLHLGIVKQIVGSTLTDEPSQSTSSSTSRKLDENFSSTEPASAFATRYKSNNLTGGHVIMLGPGNEQPAKEALAAYPNGLQIGGGITDLNAKMWLDAGASHVIVTSFVFTDGAIDYERLDKLVRAVGKERIVLDLSCRKKVSTSPSQPIDNEYYVVTNRWQKYTTVKVNDTTLTKLAFYCDEFLVHGVENEGKRCGILTDLVTLLGLHSPIPVTYAGGVSSLSDLDYVKRLGNGKVDLTIGSAIDLFGGDILYTDVVKWHKTEQDQGKEET